MNLAVEMNLAVAKMSICSHVVAPSEKKIFRVQGPNSNESQFGTSCPFTPSLHPPKTRPLTKPNSSGPALPNLFSLSFKTTTVALPQQNASIVTTRSKIHKGMNHPQRQHHPRTHSLSSHTFYPLETRSLENQKVGS